MVKSFIKSQYFNFHNMRVFIRGKQEEKPVNYFYFGAILTRFQAVFSNNLPLCNTVKALIDN